MKTWKKIALTVGGVVAGEIAYTAAANAQAANPPASYWGRAYDRGTEVADSTLIRAYDTNGTGDGKSGTSDDQLIGEGATFTANGQKGWFTINALTDNPLTPADEGALSGANVYFKLVRKSDGKVDLAYQDANLTTHVVTHEPGKSKNVNAYTDFSTGIEPVNAFGVKLYPNPTNGMLNLDLGDGEAIKSVKIFDMNGRLYQYDMNGGRNGSYQLNLDGMSSGLYFMTIEMSDGRKGTKKFIKQ
jgi:hypothetical protein